MSRTLKLMKELPIPIYSKRALQAEETSMPSPEAEACLAW